MSRNSKNAKRNAQAKEISKQRQSRRAAGNLQKPGQRATAANHGKKKAWWQLGSYESFVKGKQKVRGKRTESTDSDE